MKKNYSKDVVRAISWAAAEYKYLQDLSAEITKLEADTKPEKHLRKAAHFLRYIGKAERRADRFENTVGKDLQELCAELSEKVDYSAQLKGVILTIRMLMKEFGVEKANLEMYASWHVGKLDKDFAHLKKGESPEAYHQLVGQLEKDTEVVDTWIKAIEVSLQKAKGLLEGMPKEDLTKRGYEILRKYRFPVDKYPEEAAFMAEHPHDLEEMSVAAGMGARGLFTYGLPAVKDLITVERWPGLVQMAEAAGNAGGNLFYDALAVVKDLITVETWPLFVTGFVKMSQAAGNYAGYLFQSGLPAVKDLLKSGILSWEECVGGFITLIQAGGRQVDVLFSCGLGAVTDLIPDMLSWEEVVDGLSKMARAGGNYAYSLYSKGLPIVKELLKGGELSWEEGVDGLVKMSRSAGTNGRYLFHGGLLTVKDLITADTWPLFVDGLVKMSRSADEHAEYFFLHGLPAMKNLITVETWPFFVDGFVKMVVGAGKNAGLFFKFGFPAVKDLIHTKEDLEMYSDHLLTIIDQTKKHAPNTLQYTLPACKNFLQFVDFKDVIKFLVMVARKYGSSASIAKKIQAVSSQITSSDDFGLLYFYLKEWSLIDATMFKAFKAMNPEQRSAYLANHQQRYRDIVLGKDTAYTDDNLEYIYHAINSPNLDLQGMKNILSRYGQQAAALPVTTFHKFSLDKIRDVADIKIHGKLTPAIYDYYAEIFRVFSNTKAIPKIDVVNLLGENRKLQTPILNCAWSQEVCWRAFLYDVFQKLGADMQGKIKAFCQNSFEQSRQNLFGFRDYYHAIFELYNDTVKDHAAIFGKKEKEFLALHRRISRIDKLEKELKKFRDVKGKDDIEISCIPSKRPLDLFYGYYGENCTSGYPRELLNPLFIPVRMIEDNQIRGCLHFYHVTYNEKEILAILGIEPRSSLVNHVDNDKLFKYIIAAVIKEAKRHGYDAVGLPKNGAMHSNRGTIGRLIAEKMRGLELLPIEFKFPEHSGYSTRGIALIWEK